MGELFSCQFPHLFLFPCCAFLIFLTTPKYQKEREVFKVRFQKVAKLLNEAGWNLHRQSNGTHQRWINVKTGITTTISTSKGKLENYQLENLEKQFGVQLRGK